MEFMHVVIYHQSKIYHPQWQHLVFWSFFQINHILDKLFLVMFFFIQDFQRPLVMNGMTGWKLNSKTLSFKGIFASDMNYTEISPGIYNLQTESTYTNGISGASYCLFIQYNDKYKTQAVFHPTKGVMTRRYAGNPITWTDWV